MHVHPLERLLDPTELAVALIVKHAQGDDVGVGRHAGDAAIVAREDAGNVRAV